MSTNDYLCNTRLTIDWLTRVIEQRVGTSSVLKSWSAKLIGEGEGFASNILRVQLEWAGTGEGLPESVVIKVPSVDGSLEKMENIYDKETIEKLKEHAVEKGLSRMVENECQAFIWLDSHPLVKAPKLYVAQLSGGDAPGAIVMEDMGVRGKIGDVLEGLSLVQILQAARLLSRLHSESLKDSSWQTKIYMEDSGNRKIVTPEVLERLKSSLLGLFGGKFDELEEVWHFWDVDLMHRTRFESHRELGLPAVLVHGDCWANNIIFDKSNTNCAVALIDWQESHAGSCCEDIAWLLATSAAPRIIRDHLDTILTHYHNEFARSYAGGNCPITLDDVRLAYERILPFTMVKLLSAMPYMAQTPIIDGPDRETNLNTFTQRCRGIVMQVLQYTT